MTNESQLTMFGSSEIAVPEIPKSREKALAKIENEHGIEGRVNRALCFQEHKPMHDALKRGFSLGSSCKTERAFHISRRNRLNKSVGIDKINNGNPRDWALLFVGMTGMTDVHSKATSRETRDEKEKEVLQAIADCRKRIEKAAA